MSELSILPQVVPSDGNSALAQTLGSLSRSADKIDRNSGIIAPGSISGGAGGLIQTSSITASEINVGQLSAISADLGSITAGIVTGATFQTSASNPRVFMDGTGVGALDASGSLTFKADATTGLISTLKGLGGGNLLANSSAEAAVTVGSWTGSSATLAQTASATALHGGKVFQLTATGTGTMSLRHFSARVPVTAGLYYSASAHARSVSGTVRTFKVYLDWYDNTNTRISGTAGTSVTPATIGWTRASFAQVAPANAATVQIIAEFGTGTTGDVGYIDGVQIEPGYLPTSYAPKPDEILPGTVQGGSVGSTGMIAAGTVIGADVYSGVTIANRIQANNISVAQVSAITADLGVITAGIVTGATIQTSSNTAIARIVLNSTELVKYASDGTSKAVVINTTDGLDLLASTSSSAPNDRQIRWLSGATAVGYIQAWNDNVVNALELFAPNDSTHQGNISLKATGRNETAAIYLAAGKYDASSLTYKSSVIAECDASGTGPYYNKTIIDSTESSDFLQLATFASKKIKWGTVTFTFSASTLSANVSVTHNLGVTPDAVLIMPQFKNGVISVVAYEDRGLPRGATFRCYGKAEAAYTGTTVHDWVVIG